MKQLGVIGLGTMGAGLARNAARRGAEVVVYNRTPARTEEFLREHGKDGSIKGTKTYTEFVQYLCSPRAVLLMVQAGDAVDAVIGELLSLLKKGDILIDGGNSHYRDSERRAAMLEKKGIRFIGLGVSGGEEGALTGPSMMVGGDRSAYRELEPLFQAMAADDGAGGTCVAYLGPGGAGHFVKMVHNGIEYGLMQIIAETYDVLKRMGGFGNDQLAEIFETWNGGEDLESCLVGITAHVLEKKEGKHAIVDLIRDAAGQKGTGKWTTAAAMDFGVAVPTINAAVDARLVSASAEERSSAKNVPQEIDLQDPVPPPEKLCSVARHALELSTIMTYAQGMLLIGRANEKEGWGMDLSEVARIWRGGCIIRSVFLKRLQAAHVRDVRAAESAKEKILERFAGERQRDWRCIVTYAASRGIPVPAMAASLSYFDALRAESLPQNLIQALRDYFGAHGFERVDREGIFHGVWR